jgi:arylsulfatase A-like enzyme
MKRSNRLAESHARPGLRSLADLSPALGAGLGLLGLLAGSGCTGRAARPNVILVVVDSLRADAVGADGAKPSVSPVIDRLASAGLRCERAVAQAGWNLPSVSSLMTSVYPGQHGQGVSGQARGDVATLAEVLASNGYQTTAFTEAGWPLLERGFRAFTNTAAPRLYGDPERSSAAKSFGAARDWIEGAAPQPFFLFVHTYEVQSYFMGKAHAHAQARAENPVYKGRFLDWGLRDTAQPIGPRVTEALLGARPEDIAYAKGLYRGALANVDAEIGRMVETLDRKGLARNTIVVVTSSNGEGFRPDLKRVHHGGRLHDDQLHVPLVVYWPGRLVPGSIRSLVELLDLAPTMLTLAGLPADPRFSGTSLVAPETGLMARLRGPRFVASSKARKTAFAEESLMRVLPSGERVPSTAQQTALYSEWVKLIDGGQGAELYDLKADPGEERNLAAVQPAAVAALRSQAERVAAHAPAAGVESETQDQLRSLGYVQ